jgi:RND family efflux transporter MFP subunit
MSSPASPSPPDLSRLRISREDPPAPPRAGGRVWLVLAAVLVVAAVVLVWTLFAPRTLEVQVALAAATGGGTVSGAGITANGYVVARTRASVSAKILGRLTDLRVSEGSRVRKNDVIARIEDAEYQAASQAARARAEQLRVEVAQAERDWTRARRLAEQNLISTEEREAVETRLASTRAQYETAVAQAKLAAVNVENAVVRAPFDGTVLRKDAEVGEIVAPSSAGGGLTRTAIVTMADLGTLEVEVDVNEAYIAQVGNGQPSRITLDAYPDTSFAGRVRQVVPTADRQKATVQVKVSILDRDPRILPEMGAKVEFVREEAAAAQPVAARRVLVPSAAVAQTANGATVWIVSEGKVSARAVDVGPARGDQVEIRKGLDGGESVVLGPPAGLREGLRVRVRSS